jgi:hypothetical protein
MQNIQMRKQNQTCLNVQKPFKTQTTYAQVTINGTAIENLDKFVYNLHRSISRFQKITFLEYHLAKHKPYPTAYGILKPLPPGEHKIGFKGTSVDFTTGATNTFVSDATYNVIVR